MTRFWTCQRQTDGVKCKTVNPRVKRNCAACGKPRPATSQPAHMTALELTYDQYVELNGGDHCAICRRDRTPARRLDRDHDHATGQPRGLLCHRCNRALPSWVTPEWLRTAAAYLDRAAAAAPVRAVTSQVGRQAA